MVPSRHEDYVRMLETLSLDPDDVLGRGWLARLQQAQWATSLAYHGGQYLNVLHTEETAFQVEKAMVRVNSA